MNNFWEKLNKPFFCLAPMLDVTDVAFREMFAKYSKTPSQRIHSTGEEALERGSRSETTLKGKNLSGFSPSNNFVMYTEFVNVDGLTHPEGFKRLALDLKFTEIQRPIVAQIWGRSPIKFEEAAKIVASLGFDGIDINFGCPQDKEVSQGTCAALIKQPELAIEIIKATKKGAGNLPVSVKTRLGYNENTIGIWLRHLLSAEPAAIAIHGRTKKEKSKVPANWSAIADAVKTRDEMKSYTLIIGNGDVKSLDESWLRAKGTSVDGVMVGRGAFGNPWFFRKDNYEPTVKERLSVMLEHAKLFEKEFSGVKPFVIMRKHFKAYVSGFDGASELRAKLMEAKDLEQAEAIIKGFYQSS